MIDIAATVAALLMLIPVAVVHRLLGRHSMRTRGTIMLRILLSGVGAAFAWACVRLTDTNELWVILAAFGLVHLPAAAILSLKELRMRGY